jgi:hypothetical protein
MISIEQEIGQQEHGVGDQAEIIEGAETVARERSPPFLV